MMQIATLYYTLPLILSTILNENAGDGITYDVGLNAATVFNGMIAMVSANIIPILTLMGLALGMGWVVQYFNSARKGRLR